MSEEKKGFLSSIKGALWEDEPSTANSSTPPKELPKQQASNQMGITGQSVTLGGQTAPQQHMYAPAPVQSFGTGQVDQGMLAKLQAKLAASQTNGFDQFVEMRENLREYTDPLRLTAAALKASKQTADGLRQCAEQRLKILESEHGAGKSVMEHKLATRLQDIDAQSRAIQAEIEQYETALAQKRATLANLQTSRSQAQTDLQLQFANFEATVGSLKQPLVEILQQLPQ